MRNFVKGGRSLTWYDSGLQNRRVGVRISPSPFLKMKEENKPSEKLNYAIAINTTTGLENDLPEKYRLFKCIGYLWKVNIKEDELNGARKVKKGRWQVFNFVNVITKRNEHLLECVIERWVTKEEALAILI